MKRIGFLIVFFNCILIRFAVAQSLTVVENLKSDFKISISSDAGAIEKQAASELQTYLQKISGVKLPIVNDLKGNNQFVIGKADYIKQTVPDINFNELGEDGFLIKRIGSRIIFAGGTDKGTLYAVYSFLEMYLNCRMYAPDAVVIPKKKTILLNEVNALQIPTIKYRETFYWPSRDVLYANWHKVDRNKGNSSQWGNWVHSALELVPPVTYFKDHPEYYAERNGKRVAAQLCLSNDKVYQIVVSALKDRMAKNPNARYWSVSQEDNGNFCQCEQCKAVDAKQGSPSGSIINFVNKVAGNFPDKTINTLAYSYSVVPPATLKPANNVLVAFCTSGNLDRGKPYHLDANNSNYIKNITRWGQISSQFMIWDYIVDFKNYTMPYPNLAAIPVNIKYFVKNNATALFMHGNYYGGGEFAELKCYLTSKLMWDPNADSKQIIQDFMLGYYGKAAPYVNNYLQALTLAYQNSNAPLGMFDNPNDHLKDYLSSFNSANYLSILSKAAKSVTGNQVLSNRVKRIIASVNYGILTNGMYNAISNGNVVKNTTGKLTYSTKDYKRLDQVYQVLKEEKVERLSEMTTTPEEFKTKVSGIFNGAEKMFVPNNLALNKKISLTYPPTTIHAKYAGNNALIDGLRGDLSSGLDTWQGFYGGRFEGIIDLLKPVPVKSISIDFLKTPAVNVVYPEDIKFYYSADGKNYTEFINLQTSVVERNAQSEVTAFSVSGKPVNCRYIKISAFNKAKAPMLTDEIIVK
jgi:hypothetical protein